MKDKYEVGYGKPPKATRFGNRPQPNRSWKSGPARGAAINVAAAINRPMKVVHRGAAVRIHPHEALMQGLAKSGLSGKLGAIKEFLLECKKAGLLDAPLTLPTSGVITAPKGVPIELAARLVRIAGPPPWDDDLYDQCKAEYERDLENICKVKSARKKRGDMKKQNRGISAEGRTPPPAENRFRKGRSGNPTGRPKGSISISGLTRKVAVKKHSVRLEGKACKVTMLELLILKLNRMAASGQPGAARLINWLRSQTEPHEAEVAAGGFLLAPAAMTSEEFMAEMEARDAGKVEPGTEINIDTEESLKVARGEASPLGEALRSFNEKYGAGPAI